MMFWVVVGGCAVLAVAALVKWGLEPAETGPHVGPYGQIEGEPSDDPYDPPEMRERKNRS